AQPQGETEIVLARIWGELLGIGQVGRYDNFFELGGHSLLAVKLVSQFNERTSNTMHLTDIYKFPILKDLAGCQNDNRTSAINVFPVRVSGTQKPIFCFPSGLGTSAYAHNLTHFIDSDIPLYGLVWPETMPSSMEALAARMVETIRAIQPKGPYRFVGYSSGGVLAYASAQCLVELDDLVEFVALVDTPLSNSAPIADAERESAAKDLLLDDLRAGGDGQLAARAEKHKDVSSLEELLDIYSEETMQTDRCIFGQQNAATYVAQVNYQNLVRTFMPSPLPGKIHLFNSKNAGQPWALGWERTMPTDRIKVVSVPCTHNTLMKNPNVGTIGSLLCSAISDASRSDIASARTYVPSLRLQNGNISKSPLICVPGAGATVSGFLPFIAALDADLPIVGLQPRGTDGHTVSYGSVELEAACYVREAQALFRS